MGEPMRIWALHCPFDKYGVPVLGTSGRSIGGVVIFRAEDWTRLCREHPTLATEQFSVGYHEEAPDA